MPDDLRGCNGRNMTVLGSVVDNTFCNVGVIGEGLKLWMTGQERAPWANNLFEP